MEEGASPPRWALDKKLGEDASMEKKKASEDKESNKWKWEYWTNGEFLGLLYKCPLY